jgi:tetratricopeptide (TPR) repeat protein
MPKFAGFMKKHIFSYLIAALILSSCNQQNNSVAEKQHDIMVYHQAVSFGDIGTAIYSIHSLMARDTANLSYYDSLAVLYYNSNNFPQAIQAGQKALLKEPNSEKLMRIVSDAAKRMGKAEIALPYFLKLSELTKNPEFDYEAAVLRFYGQQYDEAEKGINKVLDMSSSDKYFVVIVASDNKQQRVPLKAALLNLLGFIRQKQDKKDEARDNYQKSLAIFPDFILAKNNLEALNK